MAMLFACSRLGSPIFSYGEGADFSALSKLVVTVGALSSSYELFQISVGGNQYVAKPFIISGHLFYCVCCLPDCNHTNLVVHMLGNTIQRLFWEEYSVLLDYLDCKSAAEMNSSTIMDTLGGAGAGADIQETIAEVFPEERVRDSFLMFEEHFMRGLASPQMGTTFTRWFDPMCKLQRITFSLKSNQLIQMSASGTADIFLLEILAPEDDLAGPFHNQLHSARIVDNATEEVVKPSGNRRALCLDSRCVRHIEDHVIEAKQVIDQMPAQKLSHHPTVIILPASTMLVVSLVTNDLVLVLRCSFPDAVSQLRNSTAQPSTSSTAVSLKGNSVASQTAECLSEELRLAWLACCRNIATALPRPTEGPRDFELTA